MVAQFAFSLEMPFTPGTLKNNCMRGDPTYRIFDELSSYRFSVTQPGRLAFFENLLFQIATADGVASECIPADGRTRGSQETLSRARPYIRIRRRLTGQARGCVLHGRYMDQSLP